MTTGTVCVIGSLNADLVVRAPHLPRAGETLMGGSFETHPGGKGANQAVAARRMGAAVAMVGCLGDDANSGVLHGVMAAEGIGLEAVTRLAGTPTGVALITIDEASGENTIVVAPGANAWLTPAHVHEARGAIERAGVVLMQLEVPIEAVEEGLRLAGEAGVTAVLNAAPAAELSRELLGRVGVLVVNQTEAATLTEGSASDDPESLAGALLDLGAGSVVVTLGASGSMVVTSEGVARLSSARVEAVDTVGAGDAFTGVLACALAEGRPLEEASRLGSAAGALAATRAGAIPSLPRRADVEKLAATLG